MRRSRTAAVGTAAILLTGIALAAPATVTAAASSSIDATSTDGLETSTDGLDRFREQTIGWHKCQLNAKDDLGKELDAVKARCAEVTLPLDYRDPGGRTISVAISRLKATDPAKRRGILLTNPGGPGASGLAMPLLSTVSGLGTRYDTIGMDPRGVERSTQINCAWPTATNWGSAGPDRRGFDRSVAIAKDLAARCARTSKDMLPFVSTRYAARDMDVIRAVLREEKMSYFAWSYGTELGAVYLQMFPERADRFVLDSAVDPDTYGPAAFRANNAAITAALRNWARWTARHHKRYHLGRTTSRVLATVDRIRTTTDRHRLKVGKYRVDSSILPLLVWADNDLNGAYAELAATVRVLRDAARGKKVTPTPALAETLKALAAPEPGGEGGSAQMAIMCADRAVSRDLETYWQDIQAHRTSEPLYGPLIRNVTPCAFWPNDPIEPPTKISNDAPALILNATGDTQTTYTGALAMHRAMTGSRLVTLKGAFQHGVYFAGSACADATVNRYLLDGVLPATNLTCTRDKTTGAASRTGLVEAFARITPAVGR